MSIFRTGVFTGGARKNAPSADMRPVNGQTEHGPQPAARAGARPLERFLQGYPATVIWQGFSLFAAGAETDVATASEGRGLSGAANSNTPRQAMSLPLNTQPTESQDLPQPSPRRVTVTPAVSTIFAYQYPEFQK